MTDLATGDVVWVSPDLTIGREQRGRRPAIIVAGAGYLRVVDTLALIVPVTSVDRGWPNHVPVAGLPGTSWAMTEQLRATARERLHGRLGQVDEITLASIRSWIRDFLEL